MLISAITKKMIEFLPLNISLGYVTIIAVLYIISIGNQMLKFNAEDISMILKENKD